MSEKVESVEDGAQQDEPPSSGFLTTRKRFWKATRAWGRDLGSDAWKALKLILVLMDNSNDRWREIIPTASRRFTEQKLTLPGERC